MQACIKKTREELRPASCNTDRDHVASEADIDQVMENQ